jgi:hypothetical protein
VQKWIALAEVVLGNLAWISELDIEGWLVATAAAGAIGVGIWIFVGPGWLLLAATLYLGLLIAVKVLVARNDQKRRVAERGRQG